MNFSCFLLFPLLPCPPPSRICHIQFNATVSYLRFCCWTCGYTQKLFTSSSLQGLPHCVHHFTVLSYDKKSCFIFAQTHKSICTCMRAKQIILPVNGDFVIQSVEALSTFCRWRRSRLLVRECALPPKLVSLSSFFTSFAHFKLLLLLSHRSLRSARGHV